MLLYKNCLVTRSSNFIEINLMGSNSEQAETPFTAMKIELALGIREIVKW